MTLRGALGWAGIVLLAAVWLLLLQWPLTRPWLIGVLMVVVSVSTVKALYGLIAGRTRFDRAAIERLALCVGGMCLLAHMMWDIEPLSLIGLLLILGSTARSWHEGRRVSDSSGPIAR